MSTRGANQPDDRWLLWETGDLDVVLELPDISATLKVAEIYDRVPGIPAPVETVG